MAARRAAAHSFCRTAWSRRDGRSWYDGDAPAAATPAKVAMSDTLIVIEAIADVSSTESKAGTDGG